MTRVQTYTYNVLYTTNTWLTPTKVNDIFHRDGENLFSDSDIRQALEQLFHMKLIKYNPETNEWKHA